MVSSLSFHVCFHTFDKRVGPCPFRQKDRVAILLGKVFDIIYCIQLSDQYLLSTQKLVIAAILILLSKRAFSNVLESVTLEIFSWEQAPHSHFFLPTSLACQCKVFVARIPNNYVSSFQHTLCS